MRGTFRVGRMLILVLVGLTLILVLGIAGCMKRAPESSSVSVANVQTNSHQAGERLVKTVNGVEFAFRWCPAGTFTMGSPANEENRDSVETLHEVTLSKGFWMLETEVTQEMWQNVMGSSLETQAKKMLEDDTKYGFGVGDGVKLRDMYGFERDEDPKNTLRGAGSAFPMYYVSWWDCEDFCRKLSTQIGLKLALPTEAQWEYACRAGSTGPYAGDLDAMGWYGDITGTPLVFDTERYEVQPDGKHTGTVHPVRQKQPNAWGLYDMHGNVWEWCLDWYDDYPSGCVTDPRGPARGVCRIHRGGCWNSNAGQCRSACRAGGPAGGCGYGVGFRPIGFGE